MWPLVLAAIGAGAGAGGDGDEGNAWGDDLDLGLEEVELPGAKAAKGKAGGAAGAGGDGSSYVPVSEGQSTGTLWMANSSCAADHVAAGSYETAMQLLNRQIGVVNFAPLRPHFLSIYCGAHAAVPTLPSLPSLDVGVLRNAIDAAPPGARSCPVSLIRFVCVRACVPCHTVPYLLWGGGGAISLGERTPRCEFGAA